MSFKDLKGQARQAEYFRHILNQDRLASSYLFIGPRGIGKSRFALTLAKRVNCLEDTLDSCDKCSSCKKIDKNIHPDVHLIEPDQTQNIKIESIRELKRKINFRSFEAKKTVFIIKHAHLMTAESSNAFLKILEEPNKNSLIILITENVRSLFLTIISRCQKIFFGAPQRNAIADVCEEKYNFDPAVSHFFAYFCEGRMGVISEYKKNLDLFVYKNRIIDSIVKKRDNFLLNEVESKRLERKQLYLYLDVIVSLVRDLWLFKLGVDSNSLINLDREKEILLLSKKYSISDLEKIFDFIMQSYTYLDKNINIKLLSKLLSDKVINV